jgi:hypothetical protein
VCQGSLIPVYALFETIQLISHLPLVVPNMPSRLVSFLKPINDLMRANFVSSANNYFCEKFGIEQDESQFLDQTFKDFGYESSAFLPNTITMFVVLLSGLILIILLLVVDFVLKHNKIVVTKKLPPLLVSGLVRNIMLFSLELVLCILLHFINHEENRGQIASMFFSVITAVVLCFLGLYGIIQMCPNQIKCGLFCITFFDGLNPDHPQRSAMYPVFFLIRRVLYVVILVHLRNLPIYQVCLFMILSIAMLMTIGSKQLFDNRDHTMLHLFNEFNVFLLTGLCIAFTNIT